MKDGKYRMAWRRGCTIFGNLRNGKESVPKDRKAGIYSIPIQYSANNNVHYYIGSTCRNLRTRLKEHKADIHAGRLSTALAIKAYEDSIIIDWNKARVIKQVNDAKGLMTLEAIQLERLAQNNLTIDDTTPVDLPASWRWCAINSI